MGAKSLIAFCVLGGQRVQLFDVKKAAEMLAVSPWTVRAYIRAGKLRPIRVGRLVRLDEQELENFVASAKASPNLQEQTRMEEQG